MQYKDLKFIYKSEPIAFHNFKTSSDYIEYSTDLQLGNNDTIFEFVENKSLGSGSFNTVYIIKPTKINNKHVGDVYYIIKFWNEYDDLKSYNEELEKYNNIYNNIKKHKHKTKYTKRLLKSTRILFYGNVITAKQKFPYYIQLFLGVPANYFSNKLTLNIKINRNKYIYSIISQIKKQSNILINSGYIHCDLKYDNILFKLNERSKLDVYIIDFSNMLTIEEWGNKIMPLTSVSIISPEGYFYNIRNKLPYNYINYGIAELLTRIISEHKTYSYQLSRYIQHNSAINTVIKDYILYPKLFLDKNVEWNTQSLMNIYTCFFLELYLKIYIMLNKLRNKLSHLTINIDINKLFPSIIYTEQSSDISYLIIKCYKFEYELHKIDKLIHYFKDIFFTKLSLNELKQLIIYTHDLYIKSGNKYWNINSIIENLKTKYNYTSREVNEFIQIFYYIISIKHDKRII
jgi:hypothetical protein